ncbi:MAG: hypothetical protein II366_00135 [Clostridia bacterium]|nr:hypothetical protein [Clostridia bacterium]
MGKITTVYICILFENAGNILSVGQFKRLHCPMQNVKFCEKNGSQIDCRFSFIVSLNPQEYHQ